MPECVMCLITREVLKSPQFGLRIPNPDFIIDKNHLGGENKYKEYVGKRILALLRRGESVSIDWKTPFAEAFSSFKDARGKKADEEEVQSLIEQCLFNGDVSDSGKAVLIDRLAGGRSGSAVLSCRMKGAINYGITGVIKISHRKNADVEIDNYNKYVKWVLPYTWKVEILGTGITETLGAICYSFAFDGSGKPNSATDLLRAADSHIVPLVCSSIFSPTSKTWYSQILETSLDASQYFQRPPFFQRATQIQDREEKLLQKFIDVFGDSFVVTESSISLFGRKAPRPNHLLFTNDWGRVEECISHGDLNANNILVNSSKDSVVFIDFQNTGRHHIYRDFISFESSIRIDWAITITKRV